LYTSAVLNVFVCAVDVYPQMLLSEQTLNFTSACTNIPTEYLEELKEWKLMWEELNLNAVLECEYRTHWISASNAIHTQWTSLAFRVLSYYVSYLMFGYVCVDDVTGQVENL